MYFPRTDQTSAKLNPCTFQYDESEVALPRTASSGYAQASRSQPRMETMVMPPGAPFSCLHSRVWMTLTRAIKLHPMALLEAKQKHTVWVKRSWGERPVIGAPETWIQIQLWNRGKATFLWTSVSSPTNPKGTSRAFLNSLGGWWLFNSSPEV